VSERNEHSYYEISLSGTQMVIGFAVLLGCLLVAFFAGVWLGRGGRAAEQAVVARQEQTAPEETTRQGKDPASLDQFNFFSKDEQGEATPPAEPEPKPVQETTASGSSDTTLLQDVNKNQPQAANGTSAAAQPPSSEPKQPAAAATGTAQSGAEATTGDFVIQVFSSNDHAQAQRVLEQLRKSELPVFLSPVVVEGRTMNRVRVGPFTSRDAAEAAAAKIRKSYRLDTWITQGG